MANTSALAQQIMQDQSTYTPVDKNQKKSEWERMLAMLLASQKTDAGTMAGFGLGTLLSKGLNVLKENYDARGYLKDVLANENPERRQEILAQINQSDPKQYAYIMKQAKEKGYDWAGGATPQPAPNAPQQDLSGINPGASAVQQYAQGLLGNETAFNPENTVETPFALNPDDWDDKFDIMKRLRWGGR